MLTFRLAAQRVRNLESCGLEHERPITRKNAGTDKKRRDKTGTRNVSTEARASWLNLNHAIISIIQLARY